jgi:cysteine desulfurase / selenocysteine lyase
MTTRLSTAASSGAALPDADEIARWANALFSALPGQETSISALEAQAPGPASPLDPSVLNLGPSSMGGIGVSPSLAPLGGGVEPTIGAAPLGEGVPVLDERARPTVQSAPLDVFAPADPRTATPELSPSAYGGELYILADAAKRGQAPAGQAPAGQAPTGQAPTGQAPAGQTPASPYVGVDWLTARSDQAPGGEDLDRVLASIAQPDAGSGQGASVQDGFGPGPALALGGRPAYDVQAIRRDFPILSEKINGRPLVWLDNGATTQKPQAVIDRLAAFYAHENSNVHRAAHTLAARATDAYENARKTVARFIGAGSADEIVFVRGATEAINLVAQAWGRHNVGAGDEIILSHLEHHANIVPWQQLALEKGARLKVIPVDDDGQILLSAYERLLTDRTKIVAVTHVSNALGTVVPIEAVIQRAHAAGARVLIDAAQSIAHAKIDVRLLNADFLVFSGHKVFAPTGIGALYAKRAILDATPPWQGGGNMIADVTFERTLYQDAPARFEAGTGNLADAAGLAAALEYLEQIGLENIARHEHELLDYALAGLKSLPGIKLFGTAPDKVSVMSFLLEGFTPTEVGAALDRYGIAVRAGHHCAQPILRRLGVEGTVRASLALYNSREDVDCLISALRQIVATRGGGRA